MTLTSAVLLKDIFKPYDEKIFTNFLFTLYLLPYIFSTGIKKFPSDERKENYNWLVELTFDFYKATSKKKQKKEIEALKKEVLSHPSIFFVILDLLQNLQHILLRNPEFSQSEQDTTILSRMNQGAKFRTHCYDTNLHDEELHLLSKVFPNDILPKYLFQDMNSFAVVETIIQEIYDKATLQDYAKKIKDQDIPIQEFISYITDINHLKKGFFAGGRKYIDHFHKNEFQGDIGHDIEDIISEIGENPNGIEKFQIPESIKQESKIMEKLLNFYITLLAGFSSSKSDSFYLRVYHPELLNSITTQLRNNTPNNNTPHNNNYFWKNYHQLYTTNDQYYDNIYEGIKKNKKKIIFRYHDVESNLIPRGLIAIFQETFVANLLQELNPQNTKLYIKNPVLLEVFKSYFGNAISLMLENTGNDLIDAMYHDIGALLKHPEILTHTLKRHITKKELFNLKENLYTLDFWLRRTLLQKIQTLLNTHPHAQFDDATTIGIITLMRETLLGLGILIQYFKTNHYHHLIKPLMEIYTYRILGIERELGIFIETSILNLFEEYEELLQLRLHLDDNREFLAIIIKQFKKFEAKTPNDKITLNNENIVRIKGLLQTLHSYNKRHVIPS